MNALVLVFALGGDIVAAEQALAANQPRDAILKLGGLADAKDADVRALIVLGRAFLALREYESAVEPLLRAVELKPDDKKLQRDAAWVCWGAARTGDRFAQAFLADALRHARLAGDPRLVADLLYELQKWSDALDVYRTLPDSDATRFHLRTRVGHCLAAMGKPDEARVAYGEALDEALRANDLPNAFRIAFRAKQAGKLLAYLDKRLAATPEDSKDRLTLLLHRGYAREALSMWKETVEDLRIVVRLAPQHSDARRRLARALVYLGTSEQLEGTLAEAEKLLRANLAQDPRDEMSWQSMQWLAGWAWANRQPRHAYDLLKVLHDLDPEDRDVGLNFCAMARRLAKYDEAEAAFKALLKADDEDPDVLNDYAILKDGMGKTDEAIALWRRVLTIDEINRNALENLFTKMWERGELKTAKIFLARGLEEARKADNPGLLRRWNWFRDRLAWAPTGFGRER